MTPERDLPALLVTSYLPGVLLSPTCSRPGRATTCAGSVPTLGTLLGRLAHVALPGPAGSPTPAWRVAPFDRRRARPEHLRRVPRRRRWPGRATTSVRCHGGRCRAAPARHLRAHLPGAQRPQRQEPAGRSRHARGDGAARLGVRARGLAVRRPGQPAALRAGSGLRRGGAGGSRGDGARSSFRCPRPGPRRRPRSRSWTWPADVARTRSRPAPVACCRPSPGPRTCTRAPRVEAGAHLHRGHGWTRCVGRWIPLVQHRRSAASLRRSSLSLAVTRATRTGRSAISIHGGETGFCVPEHTNCCARTSVHPEEPTHL